MLRSAGATKTTSSRISLLIADQTGIRQIECLHTRASADDETEDQSHRGRQSAL
jgi:hypothetical protein